MSVYLVCYELLTDSLIDETSVNLENFLSSLEHIQFQKTAWLIAVEDPKLVLGKIMDMTKDRDSFFINRVSELGNVGGRVPEHVKEWLFERLPQASS